MSFAKYAQFYKDNGFFAGSKIKTTVTDGTFVGEQLVLSKGNTILKTTTIPTSGKVEFFTDESGELLLSADNGTSTLSGSVTITSYATYNVTLHGEASDNKREAYANDVTMNGDTAEATVAYTGDKSSMSIVVSDHKLIKAQIDGEKVKITDAGYDKKGRCSITATIAETENYTSADVTFYVNKLTGTYGDWSTADDETISSMIARADAGEIDLADFWNIGDERIVHLDAIEAGEEVSAQPEQDITLVLLHNPVDDDYYRLTTPTTGFRYQPNYIIGVKDCLEYPTAMGYIPKTVMATYTSRSTTYSNTNSSYVAIDNNNEAEVITFLKNKFIPALPVYMQGVLKTINRRCMCKEVTNEHSYSSSEYHSYNTQGTQSCAISLMNIIELGFNSNAHREGSGTSTKPYYIGGVGVYNYKASASVSLATSEEIVSKANNDINTCGRKFQYYVNGGSLIKNRLNQPEEYLVSDTFIGVKKHENSGNGRDFGYSMAFYVDNTGVLATNNLMSEAQRKAKRGLSPIMFI